MVFSMLRISGFFVEEAIGGEACDRGHGAGKPIPQRTNDGDMGQFGADEFARHRED